MSKTIDWLELMKYESAKDAKRLGVPYEASYNEHKNEVFYRIMGILRDEGYTLEYKGSDLGGPYYIIRKE